MIRLLIGILAAVLMWSFEAPKKLSPDELKEVIAKTDHLVLLDVREPKELVELGTLKGYTNVPLGELEKRTSEIPKDQKMVVFCNRAVRAAKGAEILEAHGYTNIIGLGAMAEWKEKNYEVVYPPK